MNWATVQRGLMAYTNIMQANDLDDVKYDFPISRDFQYATQKFLKNTATFWTHSKLLEQNQ